ncbi:S-adenosyl-L-methionine-dependent methyltransferases superfamily protein isoform 1 [Cinnamomum micranthum f. kanehirae]|uniref:S-adenosyl-L-methionine-dependent methyltransferases superfamily protein isoform 1 n=1 Tax=Cinnamomum micranthum f. kanehirae TaxID=337451 RepID=A0A3S3QHD0_9MAGN|nr:S-adenosyl-L-methionine-dependent methyltransferases superfamily protein isoform 1 [Cinnamomum micranthum f. kanehirae]
MLPLHYSSCFVPYQNRPSLFPSHFQNPRLPLQSFPIKLHQPHPITFPLPSSSHTQQHHSSQTNKPTQNEKDEDGIPANFVKTLAKFKSSHNHIRVLEVSRRADHPFAGSRLLLLDTPGNIHSISFRFKLLTNTYFDVFATLPPILPPGPIGILGFGAGSAARLVLELYPDAVIHGWELDPSVVSVGREFFGLSKLERQYPDKLFIYLGDALKADVRDGFSGILVDLFCKGSLIPELQESETWEKLKRNLRGGGRIMVNCGGSCVEAEDPRRDGNLIKEETLKAMNQVFGGELFVLDLGRRKEDSCIALTGKLPSVDVWKRAMPLSLRCYVDMWTPFS